jgi:2-keto-4-pentenoate hydratase/2-oxohepta-3-ene-1,7-dioic acid hydratase in catechol pathway
MRTVGAGRGASTPSQGIRHAGFNSIRREAKSLALAFSNPVTSVDVLAPIRTGADVSLGLNYQGLRKNPPVLKARVRKVSCGGVRFNEGERAVRARRPSRPSGAGRQLDYEVELGVIIGRSPERAQGAAYEIIWLHHLKRVSARQPSGQAQTVDTLARVWSFAPMGPCIATEDEFDARQSLRSAPPQQGAAQYSNTVR